MTIATIERLKQLNTLITTKQYSPEKAAVISEAFTTEFAAIKSRQLAEIQHIRSKLGSAIFKNSSRIFQFIKSEDQKFNLADLIAIDSELNTVNTAIVMPVVDRTQNINATALNLSAIGMTRLSEEVIEELADESFWTNLQSLDLDFNFIETLPSNINKLKSLKKLSMYDNQFAELPESLFKLTDLQVLTICSNQLTEISQIDKLEKLQSLRVSSNQLKELPNTIGSLVELKELFASQNYLTTLPESLAYLPKLELLSVWGNRLTSIPSSLVDKLGTGWSQSQLSMFGIASNALCNTFNYFMPSFTKAKKVLEPIEEIPAVDAEQLSMFSEEKYLRDPDLAFGDQEKNNHKRKSDDERGSSKRLKV